MFIPTFNPTLASLVASNPSQSQHVVNPNKKTFSSSTTDPHQDYILIHQAITNSYFQCCGGEERKTTLPSLTKDGYNYCYVNEYSHFLHGLKKTIDQAVSAEAMLYLQGLLHWNVVIQFRKSQMGWNGGLHYKFLSETLVDNFFRILKSNIASFLFKH